MLNLTDNSENKEDKKVNFKKASFNNKKLKNMPIIKHFNQIEILYLNDNEISTLSYCQDLPNLKELYMKNNKISDLKEIEYLSLCKHLHTIFLKGNPIQLNNNQLYIKRIKKAVSSIKNIDGLQMVPSKKLNLYMFLKNSENNKNVKMFNRGLLSNNIQKKKISNKDIKSIDKNNERINKNNIKIYKDFKSVDNTNNKIQHIKLKKYNKGKKIWNYVNFNETINNNLNHKTDRRRKSDFDIIKRMIDKSGENSYVNNLNIISKEENQSEIEKNNIFNSVTLLLNGLNLYQLKDLQNYVNKKLSSKLNIYKE